MSAWVRFIRDGWTICGNDKNRCKYGEALPGMAENREKTLQGRAALHMTESGATEAMWEARSWEQIRSAALKLSLVKAWAHYRV